jgi:site-specific recombinase XerD
VQQSLFHGKRHPRDMGAAEVEAFLTHLAVDGLVSASTQNQALSALLFLYKEVLGVNLPWLADVTRAKTPQCLPVVLTQDEVRRVLVQMDGVYGLLARLLYGKGMRLMEAMRLRVKDIEFTRGEIVVRDGKGGKDRMTMLPHALKADLQAHLLKRHEQFQEDVQAGKGGVYLPDALARKYPNASTQWAWQYCHPFVRTGPRHPDHPRIVGPQRCGHHHDLHPRHEQRRPSVPSPAKCRLGRV